MLVERRCGSANHDDVGEVAEKYREVIKPRADVGAAVVAEDFAAFCEFLCVSRLCEGVVRVGKYCEEDQANQNAFITISRTVL